MKKEIDFSKGVRGKYAGQEFIVIGDKSVNTNYPKMLDLLDRKEFKDKTRFFQLSDFFLLIRDVPDEHFHKLTDGKRSKVFVNVYDTNGTKLIDLLVQGYLLRTYEIAKKIVGDLKGVEIVVSSRDFEQIKDGIDKIIEQNENITFSDFLRLNEESLFIKKLKPNKTGREKDKTTLEIIKLRDENNMTRKEILRFYLERDGKNEFEKRKATYQKQGAIEEMAEEKAKNHINETFKRQLDIKIKNVFSQYPKKDRN